MGMEMTLDERQRRVELVQEGRSSEYWKLLKQTVGLWIEDQKRFIDSFNARGIASDAEREKYNLACVKLSALKQFLNINESIISNEQTLIERLKAKAMPVILRAASFVGFPR